MEMLNRAIEDADAFKKMMDQMKTNSPVPNPQTVNENREQRRKREQIEKRLQKQLDR